MSIRCNRSLSTVAIVAGIFSGMFAASPLQAQEWEWTAVPYVWASDMSLDVKVDGDEVLGSDLDFSDLLDKLDLALQLHFEGRRGRGGFFVDVTYLETSDRSTTPPRAILPGGAQLDTDAETLLVEGAGFYRLSGDATGLDLIAGVRVTDVDMELDITLPGQASLSTSVSASDTYTDGFAGLRHTSMLGNRWSLVLRGDVGAGDSDFAWNVSAYVGLHFGENNRFAVLGGYRHLVMEFEDGDVEVDLTMTGPALGFVARF